MYSPLAVFYAILRITRLVLPILNMICHWCDPTRTLNSWEWTHDARIGWHEKCGLNGGDWADRRPRWSRIEAKEKSAHTASSHSPCTTKLTHIKQKQLTEIGTVLSLVRLSVFAVSVCAALCLSAASRFTVRSMIARFFKGRNRELAV